MEIIVELIIQLFVEVIGELLFEAGLEGTGRALRSRVGRYVIAAILGLAAGLGWGAYVASNGLTTTPRSVWVSLVLAALAALAALMRSAHTEDEPAGLASVLTWPWRWPAHRFNGFAVINLAIAAGILAGFQLAS